MRPLAAIHVTQHHSSWLLICILNHDRPRANLKLHCRKACSLLLKIVIARLAYVDMGDALRKGVPGVGPQPPRDTINATNSRLTDDNIRASKNKQRVHQSSGEYQGNSLGERGRPPKQIDQVTMREVLVGSRTRP